MGKTQDARVLGDLTRTLTGDPGAATYAAVGASLGLTVDQVKKAAVQMKIDFKAELRQQVGQTLADPADVNAELDELLRAVGPK